MANLEVRYFEPVEVVSVWADKFPGRKHRAFDALISRLDELGVARVQEYGMYYSDTDDYFACAKIDQELLSQREFRRNLDLNCVDLPGGDYASRILYEWPDKLDRISQMFEAMGKVAARDNWAMDSSRPLIKDYETGRKMVLMLPVKRRLLRSVIAA